jgi:hypothetical protein
MIGKRLKNARNEWQWYADSDRGLAALLVFLVLYIFIIYPLFSTETGGGGAVSVFFSLILVAGVVATSSHHAVRAGVVVLALISLASHWLNVVLGGRVDHMVSAAAAVLFFGIQIWFLSARVFVSSGPVNHFHIMGAVAIYLLLGLMWSQAYLFMYLLSPDAFNFSPGTQAFEPPVAEMLYFSYITLTTLGFGDITAVHPFARSLVMMEGLIGQLYPAVVLARLVTQFKGRKTGDS